MRVSKYPHGGATGVGQPLRVMITSGGGPGVWGLLAALRSMPDRPAVVFVHDPAEHSTLGTLLAEAATRLPPASDGAYVDALLAFCRAQRVEVLLPVFDGELRAIARRRHEFSTIGTAVLLAPLDVLETCCDKARTYEALAGTRYLPAWHVAHTTEDTLASIAALGYPRRMLAARPLDQAGGRGLHILDAGANVFREHLLQKPGPHRLCAESFLRIRAAGPREFPLLVTEYLPGEELGIDLLADAGRVIEVVVRRKSGPALHGNPVCISFAELPGERDWVAGLAAALRLSGLLSIDARYDAAGALRLLEVNPRPGAYLGMSCARLHLLAWAVDRLLGAREGRREDYVGDETMTGGLRAFGDLVYAGPRGPSEILNPSGAAAREESHDASRVPCGASR